MPASVIVRWLEGGELREGGLADAGRACQTGAVWVDVTHPDEATLAALAEPFGLDAVFILRALSSNHRARLEVIGDGVMLDWVAVGEFGAHGVTCHGLSAWLAGDRLVTVHRADLPFIAHASVDAADMLKAGAGGVFTALLDEATDVMLERAAEIGNALDGIADSLIEPVDETRRQRVDRLDVVKQAPRLLQRQRRLLLDLRKVAVGERDALRRLIRREGVDSETYRRLQDVSDAVARVTEDIETSRDVATSVMDMYLSAVSNNLNLVMKRLTIVATIFMPGTLIVGLYGMNFHNMPELAWRFGYLFALALILVVTGGMLAVFRWRRWL